MRRHLPDPTKHDKLSNWFDGLAHGMRRHLPDPTKPLAHLQKQVARAIIRQLGSAPAPDSPVMTGRGRRLAQFIARGQRGGAVL